MEFEINGNYFINFIRTADGSGGIMYYGMYKLHKKWNEFDRRRASRNRDVCPEKKMEIAT